MTVSCLSRSFALIALALFLWTFRTTHLKFSLTLIGPIKGTHNLLSMSSEREMSAPRLLSHLMYPDM